MRILIVYGTTEGQTRKIANEIEGQLRGQGHECVEVDATQLPRSLDLASYDGVIVAARVHAGRYPRAVRAFVIGNREVLTALPSAFVSVSMAAAHHRAGDAQRAQGYVDQFLRSSRWQPRMVHHAAGARLYARHGAFGRFILGLVDAHRYDPTRDHEFTDWASLKSFIRAWAKSAQAVRCGVPANSCASLSRAASAIDPVRESTDG